MFRKCAKKTPDITFWLEFATNTIRWTLLSVVEKGEYSSVECWWWLRSPGYNQYGALGVDNEGAFDLDGYGVDDDGLAVRPVLWVNL